MGRGSVRQIPRPGKWLPYRSSKAKDAINRIYMREVKEYAKRYKRIQALILDDKEMTTSKYLQSIGVKCIISPNVDSEVVNILKRNGLDAKHMSMEEYIAQRRPNSQRGGFVYWYDGQGIFPGNADGFNPLVTVDMLMHQQKQGNPFLVGMTISTRNTKRTQFNVAPQIYIFEHQMQAVFGGNGYTYRKLHLSAYKKGMAFGLWEVTYDPENAKRVPLMMDKYGKQYIGFPADYDVKHLQ